MTHLSDTVCPLCGGHKQAGVTTFSADNGTSLVVVCDVPATICAQCGEEWIDNEMARTLERIVVEAQARHTQVEIVAL